MTVAQLIEKLPLRVFYEGDLTREIKGGYCGDLLSWVMGRAKADDAWVTVMNNVNIVAVAMLADVACIIVAEGAQPDQSVRDAAAKNDITVLTTELPVYETGVALSRLLALEEK